MSTLRSHGSFTIFVNPDIDEGIVKLSKLSFDFIFEKNGGVTVDNIDGSRKVFIHIRHDKGLKGGGTNKFTRFQISPDVLIPINSTAYSIFVSPLDLSDIGGLDVDGDVVEVFTIDGGNI